jgi:acyl-CoA synthetase (AMP-forming)/AMP-acid ligase II
MPWGRPPQQSGRFSEQSLKEWEQTKHARHDQDPAVTVLNVPRMNDRMRQKARRIDQNMPLFAFDLLTGGVAMGSTRPPFSVLFTHWLSITRAVGLASRPICSRHSI